LAPGAVRWETDHCIPDMGSGSAGLAGGVRVGSGTDRDASTSRRVPRQ
jgi:hypothetical protein